MKTSKFIDIVCMQCAFSASQDASKGGFDTAAEAVKWAKKEGWTEDERHWPICPRCNGTDPVYWEKRRGVRY